MDGIVEDPFNQIECDASLLEKLPELQFDDIFKDEDPVSVAEDGSSPNLVFSEIENLLMADDDAVPLTPFSDSDYDKLLAEILVDQRGDSDDGGSDPSKGSTCDRVDDAPKHKDVCNALPVSKKEARQMRNRDAAMRSRERKKLYVKDLEMKSKYYEGELRRLGHLLQCCYAENHALRLCLQARGAYNASTAKQESAVLFMESLLLGSLLWFISMIMCNLRVPLILLTSIVPREENMEQKDLRSITRKGPGKKTSEYFWLQSFTKSRRCRASRTKMKWNINPFVL